MELTIGQLIDTLTTQNIKLWFTIETMTNPDNDDTTVAEAARESHRLNSLRSKLVTDIDLTINKAIKKGEAPIFRDNKTYV